MNTKNLILSLCVLGCVFFVVHIVGGRCAPRGKKMIELKHFWFLFSRGVYDPHTKEVRFSVFITQLVGYILNIVAMIVVIILYCCHLDVLNYVLIFAGIEIYVFLIISGVLS